MRHLKFKFNPQSHNYTILKVLQEKKITIKIRDLSLKFDNCKVIMKKLFIQTYYKNKNTDAVYILE